MNNEHMIIMLKIEHNMSGRKESRNLWFHGRLAQAFFGGVL